MKKQTKTLNRRKQEKIIEKHFNAILRKRTGLKGKLCKVEIQRHPHQTIWIGKNNAFLTTHF